MLCFVMIIFFLFPILSLFLSFVGISISKSKISRIIYCLIISLVMALIGYFYEPSSSYDLYRIFQRADWMQYSELSTVIDIFGTNLEIGFNLSIYFITIFLGKHAIPALFTFIGYFLVFYIISDYTKKRQLSAFQTLLVILIFFFSFQHMYLISGIRNFISFIFIFALLYIEKILKKESFVTHALYIVPLLFHSSMIVFVLLRVFIEFKEKIMDKLIYLVALLSFAAPPILLYVLSFFKSNFFVYTVYQKINSYFSYNTSNFYTFMILLAMFIQLFVYLYMYIRISRDELSLMTKNKFYTYMKWFIILGFGFIRYGVLLDRILVLLSCLSIVLITDYFKYLQKFKRENIFICSCIPLFMALFLIRNQFHNYYLEIKSSINTVSQINIMNFVEVSDNYD